MRQRDVRVTGRGREVHSRLGWTPKRHGFPFCLWAELSAAWPDLARDIVRRDMKANCGWVPYFTSTCYYHPETVSGRLFALWLLLLTSNSQKSMGSDETGQEDSAQRWKREILWCVV